MKKIILISGAKRSGKDHLAKLIQEELDSKDIDSEIMSFAEPLKQIVASTFCIELDTLETYKNNDVKLHESNHKPNKPNWIDPHALIDFRSILQRFGTEAMKPIFGDKVWSTLLADRINNSKADVFIIPDFRFTAEYNNIIDILGESHGVCTIHVKGEYSIQSEVHSSEIKPDIKFDHTVDNSNRDDAPNKFAKFFADSIAR